jgi:ABC-type branched-subunit amino acid transport system substrate-binding protein
MKRLTAGTLALAAAAAIGAAWTAGGVAAADKEIVIGEQCDRTGATQLVGISLCPAILDYINLVNSQGGVEGYKIKLEEIDNEYKVPPAIEAYEKEKADGAVSVMLYGTPQTQALTKKLAEDKIPGTSPGFGTGRSDLLVAGGGSRPVYQGQSRRQLGGQEDRLPLLRQSRRPRADGHPR